MACFNGKKFKERQVSFCGDPKNGIPSSIDYISKIAKAVANINQINYVVYEVQDIIRGTYYDFEPETSGRKTFTRLVRFDKSFASPDILRHIGDEQPEPIEPEKPKGKYRKTKLDLGID